MANNSEAYPILNFSAIPILLVSLSLSLQHAASIPLPNLPHFDPDLSLMGDAHLIESPPSVQLTDPEASPTSGLLVRTKPFTVGGGLSFSTDFVFSVSPSSDDGLALLLVPADFPTVFSRTLSPGKRFSAVEYRSAAVAANVSLVVSSGVKMHSWVDYESSSKKLEVRVCEFGGPRPYTPLLAYGVDLGEMWQGEKVLVGLSSSSAKPMQKTVVYSWKLSLRSVPKWLHSKPLNPQDLSIEKGEVDRMYGAWRAVPIVFLAALAVLLLRLMLAHRGDNQIPVKCLTNPGDFGYEKVNVVGLSEAWYSTTLNMLVEVGI